MALDINELADKINEAMGISDKDGQPIATTDQMKAYASAVITTIKAGSLLNAPGTVIGMTTAGSPLQNGSADLGKIINLLPSIWMGETSKGFVGSDLSLLNQEATSSCSYITGAARISFNIVTGTTTNTSELPGVLQNGAAQGGKINDLNGTAWSLAVMPPNGDPTFSKKVYDAIVEYIQQNAECEYPSNSITGIAPVSAGPLSAGTGSGGIIK